MTMPRLTQLEIMDLLRVKEAAIWLIANRGKRGEEQAWRLLKQALNEVKG
jgi:hypothetical protein